MGAVRVGMSVRSTLALLSVAVVAAAATPATAATLTVATKSDVLSPSGRCSLREAISAVNSPGTATACGKAGTGSNTIKLGSAPSSSPYMLTITPTGGDDNTTGDLNLSPPGSLTIAGLGAAQTVIDASRLGDRVMTIGNGRTVTLKAL